MECPHTQQQQIQISKTKQDPKRRTQKHYRGYKEYTNNSNRSHNRTAKPGETQRRETHLTEKLKRLQHLMQEKIK